MIIKGSSSTVSVTATQHRNMNTSFCLIRHQQVIGYLGLIGTDRPRLTYRGTPVNPYPCPTRAQQTSHQTCLRAIHSRHVSKCGAALPLLHLRALCLPSPRVEASCFPLDCHVQDMMKLDTSIHLANTSLAVASTTHSAHCTNHSIREQHSIRENSIRSCFNPKASLPG